MVSWNQWYQELDGLGWYRGVFLVRLDGCGFDSGEGGEESVEVRGYGGRLEGRWVNQ